MTKAERLASILRIADSLDGSGLTEIDLHLDQFEIPTMDVDSDEWAGEQRQYILQCLKEADDEGLGRLDAFLHGHDPVPDQSGLAWRDGEFRLFISHLAKHKEEAKELADELAIYGVHGFVAHEDIEPNQSWQQEIVNSLRTCDALVALLRPGFHASTWTDQEVGWVLGREEPVLAVRLGEDPYGLFGSRQGFAGASKSAAVLAVEIVKILLSDPKTADAMRTAILARLMSSRSFDMSNRIIRDILTKQNGSNKNLVTLTKEEVTSIRSSENYNIQSANSLPLLSAMYKPAPKKATPPSAGKVSKTPRKKPTSTELMRRLKAAQPEHSKPRIRIKGTEQPTERSISMDAERSAGSTERRT